MTTKINFNELKDCYIHIRKYLTSESGEELAINYENDLTQRHDEFMSNLQDAILLLKKAKEANDQDAIFAALLFVRMYTIRLSNFFQDFIDDADSFIKSPGRKLLPKDYQIPEHYNFPHK